MSHKHTIATWQFESQKYWSWLTVWDTKIQKLADNLSHKHYKSWLTQTYESQLTIWVRYIWELADNLHHKHMRAGWQYDSWLTIWVTNIQELVDNLREYKTNSEADLSGFHCLLVLSCSWMLHGTTCHLFLMCCEFSYFIMSARSSIDSDSLLARPNCWTVQHH